LNKKGFFVTFEGPEGAGKSTQITLLADYFRGLGREVLVTREPGGTYVGEEIRRLVKEVKGEEAVCDEAELLLFTASRAQLMQKVIVPHLEKGGVVICDRFADSTTAYQGYARGWSLKLINRMHEIAVGACWPDVTILLDLEFKDSVRRRLKREADNVSEQDRLEAEPDQFHIDVRHGFLEIARLDPERVKVVSALGSVAEVADAVKAEIEKVLK
jgi:dTMP kinase